MKNILIIIMLILSSGCGTVKETNSLVNSTDNNSQIGNYIQISDSRYSKQFVNKEEIPFFSGELSKYFDQSAIIEDAKHPVILKIIKEDKFDILKSLNDKKIYVEIVFDRNGIPVAVSFRLPVDLSSKDLNMTVIEKKIKKNINVEIKSMDKSRKYILYSYPITSKI